MHSRSRPVHAPPVARDHSPILIYLTVCTKDRRPILANPHMHAALRDAWFAANHWLVGRYTVMPDHVHLFCAPGTIEIHPLTNWVRFWKATTSKSVGASAGTLWQTDFWDTQLRTGDSYALKWDYVRENPARAGLVSASQDWPYQGELNLLRWRE